MNAFHVRRARGTPVPIVVSIPHCGTELVPQTESALTDSAVTLPMTDWHVHRLYDFLPELGVQTIFARYSRYVVDLNRDPEGRELYPGRFETGLVPLTGFDGRPNFREPPTGQGIEALRVAFHEPYHRRLRELLDESVATAGRAVLIDAHSVSSGPNQIHDALTGDVYLGDRDGTSCDAWLTDCVAAGFEAFGLQVSRNDPYKGGYITAHYGQLPGVDALQIEMCQRLYMDESDPSRDLADRFETMQRCLIDVFARLARALERS